MNCSCIGSEKSVTCVRYRIYTHGGSKINLTETAPIRTDLTRLLRRFENCAPDQNTRNYFRIYLTGLISPLPRKNCEAIALQASEPVRSVQWFLAKQKWEHGKMRNKLQKIIAQEHSDEHSVGIIDETSFVKKGDKMPGVQRQHCGTIGKIENCTVYFSGLLLLRLQRIVSLRESNDSLIVLLPIHLGSVKQGCQR